MGDAPAALHVRVGRRRSLPPHLTDIVLWRTVSWNWRPSQRAGVYCPVGDEKDEVKMPRTGRDVRGRNVIVAGALGLGTAAIIGGAHVAPLERVYPVAEVTWGLRHHPQAWRGRTILVRGLDIDRQLALALSPVHHRDQRLPPLWLRELLRTARSLNLPFRLYDPQEYNSCDGDLPRQLPAPARGIPTGVVGHIAPGRPVRHPSHWDAVRSAISPQR